MNRQRNRRSETGSGYKCRSRALARTRVGLFEPLEMRTMLSVSPAAPTTPPPPVSWHNTSDPDDVNQDGRITPLDALSIINYLNAQTAKSNGSASAGSAQAAAQSGGNPLITALPLDVNGDGIVSALDALKVINALNSNDLVQVTLVPTDMNGVPLASVPVGTTFQLEALVSDVSGNALPIIGTNIAAGGVFETEIDATFNTATSMIDPSATVTYGANLPDVRHERQGSEPLDTRGKSSEPEALPACTSPLGPGQTLLWSIPVFTATGRSAPRRLRPVRALARQRAITILTKIALYGINFGHSRQPGRLRSGFAQRSSPPMRRCFRSVRPRWLAPRRGPRTNSSPLR